MTATSVYSRTYWVLRRYKPVLAIHFHAKANMIGIAEAGHLLKIPRIVYVVRKNVADMIRWEADRSKYMADLAKWIQRRPGRINQLLRGGFVRNRQLRALMRKTIPRKLKRYSRDELEALLRSFDELIPRCWLQSTFLPYYVGDVKGFEKVIDKNLIRRLRLVTEADEAIPALRVLASEILRRNGQRTRHPECATYEELLVCLQGRPIRLRALEQRFQHCFLWATEGGWKIETGARARQLARRFQVTAHRVSVLRGATAYPGIVTGKSFVAHHAADMKRTPPGSILVTSMTTPDFVQYFSKVSAIVTDEGGITSHAAIIAREMKKPCIIGTKIATRVLKDGDRVEVDATRGIVKKL